MAAPGSRNFRSRVPVCDGAAPCAVSSPFLGETRTEEPAAQAVPARSGEFAAADMPSHQPDTASRQLLENAGSSHISAEEVMMLIELLSRTGVDTSVKSALLHKAIDQKIEGALKTERQRTARLGEEKEGDIDRLKKRLKELLEKCDAECIKTSAALAQAEEERRMRSLAEAAAQRSASSEASQVAHLQSTLDATREREEAAKKRLYEYEEREAVSRKELQETKERLAGVTVSERLLRAYKAEKQRCQSDLEETLRAFSDPAWQEELQIEELEASAGASQATLDSLHGVLSCTRKRRSKASIARKECGAAASLAAPMQGAKELPGAGALPRDGNLGEVSLQGPGGKGGAISGERSGADTHGKSSPAAPNSSGQPFTAADFSVGSSSTQEGSAGKDLADQNVSNAEARRPRDAPLQSLPPIPKKQKVDKEGVIHIT